MEPVSVFFSYSHKDEKLRDSLASHLSILQRNGEIKSWHDRKISAGTEWANAIDENLNSAAIILLLVSADFLNSDYCYDIELKRAMQRHEQGEARVIPIILKPVDWSGAPFGKLQAFPKNAKPVTTWSNRDEAFLNIAQGIRQAATEMAEQLSTRDPAAAGSTAAPSPGQNPAVLDRSAAPAEAGVSGDLSLEVPEGQVRIDSGFYIHSVYEQRCYEEIKKPGSLIRIKSPRNMGKSYLMPGRWALV
jgi:hypothetical protein